MLIFFILLAKSLSNNISKIKDYKKDPQISKLVKYGVIDYVINELLNQINHKSLFRLKDFYITEDWIISTNVNNIEAIQIKYFLQNIEFK